MGIIITVVFGLLLIAEVVYEVEKVKEKKCGKDCSHYTNGMCFKEPTKVKIIVKGDTCKWDKSDDTAARR